MSASEYRLRRVILGVLIGLGCIALGFYFSWWFEPWQLGHAWLLGALLAGVICAGPQLLGNWLLYLKAMPFHARPEPDFPFTVDVYVTAWREDPVLVRKTVVTARDMKGRHQTWLLDDGCNAEYARLAQECNVGYLTREDRKDAKAGNVNAALARTCGEIIAIFDIDHVPEPSFLEYALSYFNEPRIGFVQVMLTFRNSQQSWIARAASESSFDYYNPTCQGAERLRGVTLTGSNALIRRTALESIGGYQPGLAEDLATSIKLHSAGWQSVYVPEPLAPGLAPVDQVSWSVQQFKWSRGVFELLLTKLGPCFKSLTNGQRMSYLVRMTYYWIGPVVCAHLVATMLALFSGNVAVYRVYADYWFHLLPLALLAMTIRQVALTSCRHEQVPDTVLWRPTALVFATWPVYSLAWLMALLRIPLNFQPTPKAKAGRQNPWWLVPQALSIVLLASGSLYALNANKLIALPLVAVALLMILAQIPFLIQYEYEDEAVFEHLAERLRVSRHREPDHADPSA